MNEFMMELFKIFIMLLGAILTYKVVPVIKGKVTADQINQAYFWVQIAVNAAEQLWQQAGKGQDKKEYVIAFLKSKGITITEQELDALIEAAVYEMNRAKNLLEKDLSLSEGR